MNTEANPYSPGAGRQPAALIGRDRPINAWAAGLRRVERGRDAQPIALYGLRGVGKTVLLARMAAQARSQGWLVAKVEAGQGVQLREMLGEALHGPLADLAPPGAGVRLLRALKTAVSFKASYDTTGTWNFGVDLTEAVGGGADTGKLETDLRKIIHDVSDAMRDTNKGLAILIDEAQDLAPEELATLSAVVHIASQETWPLHTGLAGLPSLPKDLSEAKSYAERQFNYERIEQLPPALAAAALRDPANEEGVAWDDDALGHAVNETGGYPYFLQQFGQDIWNTATQTGRITLIDAKVGTEVAKRALDNGFYRSRWDRATKAEQAYLRAMAEDGEQSSNSGLVAERMGRRPSSLGPARASLINKGLVYAPDHGQIAFTVPGMADFISRQPT